LGERVAARTDGRCTVLSAVNPQVIVAAQRVRWNGVELTGLDALIVEAPWISWPQPIAEGRAGEPAVDMQRRGIAQRERRALHVAALRIARSRIRVINDPERAADLAMCSALALERLAAAGVPTCRWSVVATPSQRAKIARISLTAEHGPTPRAHGAALEIDLGAGEVTRHLCIADEWIASAKCASLHAPLPNAIDTDPPSHAELAQRALAQLGLEIGCVHVANGAVAFVDAAADLQAWDLASDGRVAGALANWLTRSPIRIQER